MSTTQTGDEIARELETFYRYYIDVFNREDDRFFDCFAPVYQIVGGDRGLTTVTNDAKYHNEFRNHIMKAFKERGWVRSEIDRLKTWALADNLGMIISDVTRRKADNSVMDQLRAIYTARRAGNSWQFITVGGIMPPFLGPGDLARQ
jgi:hypothetical protein